MDGGYGGRVPKRVDHEERRREISDALVRTAATRGLQATGMREVAAEAGVSLRLVQYYFGTKEELLLAAMQQLAAQFSDRAMARIRQSRQGDGPASPRDVIAAILTEALPADDERRTFTLVYTAYLALSLTDPALAISPLVRNSNVVSDVVATQLRAARPPGGPWRERPYLQLCLAGAGQPAMDKPAAVPDMPGRPAGSCEALVAEGNGRRNRAYRYRTLHAAVTAPVRRPQLSSARQPSALPRGSTCAARTTRATDPRRQGSRRPGTPASSTGC